MKALKKQLEKIQLRIQAKIDKRELAFMNKSYNWQDSERGEAYEEMTEAMGDVLENLENAIYSCDDFRLMSPAETQQMMDAYAKQQQATAPETKPQVEVNFSDDSGLPRLKA